MLLFWLEPYYEAFGDLSTCRPVDSFSGSVGRVPWTAISEYAKRYEQFEEDFEIFKIYINALDDKMLKLIKDTKPPERRPRKKAE